MHSAGGFGEFEQMVLLAVVQSPEDVYGVPICRGNPSPHGTPRLVPLLVEHAVPRDMPEDVSGGLIELFHCDSAAEGASLAPSGAATCCVEV
jgi:hypothetical protein